MKIAIANLINVAVTRAKTSGNRLRLAEQAGVTGGRKPEAESSQAAKRLFSSESSQAAKRLLFELNTFA